MASRNFLIPDDFTQATFMCKEPNQIVSIYILDK